MRGVGVYKIDHDMAALLSHEDDLGLMQAVYQLRVEQSAEAVIKFLNNNNGLNATFQLTSQEIASSGGHCTIAQRLITLMDHVAGGHTVQSMQDSINLLIKKATNGALQCQPLKMYGKTYLKVSGKLPEYNNQAALVA